MLPVEYTTCGGGEAFFLSKKKADSLIDIDIDKLITKYTTQLFDDNNVDKPTRKKLLKSFYKPLKEATEEGFGKPIASIAYNTPNYHMLKNLQTNTAVFSMFKSEALIKEASSLLKDENGNLRSKADFYKEALKIDNTYRKNYAAVEYDTAVRQSRMASIWAKAQETKKSYPNFEYLHTRSAKARVDHEAYVGIILPIDDPFWNTHYPPNGYGCKCGIRVTDKEVTDIPANIKPPDEGFRMNSGKLGQCFDLENSAYIKSVPPKEQPALIRDAKKIANNDILNDIGYQQLGASKGAGKIEVHPLTFDNSDFKEVLAGARDLAKQKVNVKMLPGVANTELRNAMLPVDKIKGSSCPDYFINELFVADLKTLNQPTAEAVSGAFKRCREQCDNIILKIADDNTITSQQLYRFTKGKLTHEKYNEFNNVWIQWKGDFYKTTRKNIVNNNHWPLP